MYGIRFEFDFFHVLQGFATLSLMLSRMSAYAESAGIGAEIMKNTSTNIFSERTAPKLFLDVTG